VHRCVHNASPRLECHEIPWARSSAWMEKRRPGATAAAWKQDAGVKAPPHPGTYGCGGVATIGIASGILRMLGVDENIDIHPSGAQFPLVLRTGRQVLEGDVRVLAWPLGFRRSGRRTLRMRGPVCQALPRPCALPPPGQDRFVRNSHRRSRRIPG